MQRSEIVDFDEERQVNETAEVVNAIHDLLMDSNLSVAFAHLAITTALIEEILLQNDTVETRRGAMETMIHVIREAIAERENELPH